jgi:hypothetical protein
MAQPITRALFYLGTPAGLAAVAIALSGIAVAGFWMAGWLSRTGWRVPILQWISAYISLIAAVIAVGGGLAGLAVSWRRRHVIGFCMSLLSCAISGSILFIWFALATMGSMH